jgi:hypothetical protein
MDKIFDTIEEAGQLTFYAIVGVALGIGTCWAVTGLVTEKIIDKLCNKKKDKI